MWCNRIESAWDASRESTIEVGRLLIAAKEELPHGEFGKMLESELPFSGRTAQRLMRIADDPRLTNTTHASLLPTSWSVLYELSRLRNDEFERHLAVGAIRADMSRDDALRLLGHGKTKAAAGRRRRIKRAPVSPEMMSVVNGTVYDKPAIYDALAGLPSELQAAAVAKIKEAKLETLGEDATDSTAATEDDEAVDPPDLPQQRPRDGLRPSIELRRLQNAWKAAGPTARYQFIAWLASEEARFLESARGLVEPIGGDGLFTVITALLILPKERRAQDALAYVPDKLGEVFRPASFPEAATDLGLPSLSGQASAS
jgi:hypothetical protein